MKRIFLLLTMAVFLAFSFYACSSSKNYSSDSVGEGGDYAPEAAWEDSDYESDGSTSYQGKPEKESTENVKKIIRNATINMSTKDVKQAYTQILTYAKEKGGYEFSQSTNTYGEYTSVEAVIKIPADSLDLLTEYINDCGDVINCNVTATDITDQYYDAEIRLKTKKASLEQYYKMLAECDTIEDILRVQEMIDSLTEDIEAIQGRLKVWSNQVAESTLTLTIQQTEDPNKIKKDIQWNALTFSDMGILIVNGLVWTLNLIVSILQWLLIIIIVLSPLLLIGGIVFFIIYQNKRKKKNAVVNPPAEQK